MWEGLEINFRAQLQCKERNATVWLSNVLLVVSINKGALFECTLNMCHEFIFDLVFSLGKKDL